MTLAIFIKDPDSTLDYKLNWRPWLRGDTISTSEWEMVENDNDLALTEVSETQDDTTATVFVSGGVAGETYEITNTIVTAGGRTEQRTLTIVCKER